MHGPSGARFLLRLPCGCRQASALLGASAARSARTHGGAGRCPVVVGWAQAVRARDAWLHEPPTPSQAARALRYVELGARAHGRGLAYAREKEHAGQALAKRRVRHADERFQFVLVAGRSADNHLAERSMRPLVVIRKISGGSRSTEGTKTRMALASVFETWQARGRNPLEACHRLLSQPTISEKLLYPKSEHFPSPTHLQCTTKPITTRMNVSPLSERIAGRF